MWVQVGNTHNKTVHDSMGLVTNVPNQIRYQMNTVPTPTAAWTRVWLVQGGGVQPPAYFLMALHLPGKNEWHERRREGVRAQQLRGPFLATFPAAWRSSQISNGHDFFFCLEYRSPRSACVIGPQNTRSRVRVHKLMDTHTHYVKEIKKPEPTVDSRQTAENRVIEARRLSEGQQERGWQCSSTSVESYQPPCSLVAPSSEERRTLYTL